MTQMTLPTNPTERKATPMWRGCVRFFAAALAGVARMSQEFNSYCELRHDRKTTDHMDCAMRHAMNAEDLIAAFERGRLGAGPDSRTVTIGTPDGTVIHAQQILDEVDQATWRMLAWSQAMHEKYGGAPLAPGAVQPSIPEPPHAYENGRCWCGQTHELPLTVGGTMRGPQSVPLEPPLGGEIPTGTCGAAGCGNDRLIGSRYCRHHL